MDFTTNYCGMYYSDGKIQSSVANGKSKPVSALDNACRDHDTAYANAIDDNDRNAADNKFYNDTKHLGLRGQVYGNLVKYGNQAARKGKMAFLLPFGALAGASAGATALLSGLLPGKHSKSSLRKEVAVSNDGSAVVYDPGSEPSPSGGGFLPAIPTTSKASDAGSYIPTTWATVLRDPRLMEPIDSNPQLPRKPATKLYKPLKRKDYGRTPSMIRLHYKYNPPKNKTKNNKVLPSL